MDRWNRVQELFHRLAPLSPRGRAQTLARLEQRDAILASEVASLLAAHDGRGAVDQLLAVLVPDLPWTNSDENLSGARIGHYSVLERIGRGGMGDVYRARGPDREDAVAIKVLPAWTRSGSHAEERFLAEARAASLLDHPSLCSVIETGSTESGRLYLVMPYYEGETLSARLARGAMPVADAIAVALQVAQGLVAAHGGGIIHRDIKPANLMLTRQGQLKILDFGVAKLAGVHLTRTGQKPGTLHYMSPEQMTGGTVDARSDLWSLGAVLFEMLTGQRPFGGDNPVAVARAVAASSAPPASSLRAEVPAELDAIVDRLLQRNPDNRHDDAAAVTRELGALQAP